MDLSLEELHQSNVIAEEMKEALSHQPFPNLPATDAIAHREARADHLRKLRHLMPVPGPIPELVKEEIISVDAADGYAIPVHTYRPAKSAAHDTHPLVVLIHEGGWAMGDATDEEFNARLLTRALGVVCLNVEYRLAPEHRFPTGVSDCWSVVQWAAKNSSMLGADPRKGFIVGGSSAGGNISAIMALRSREEGLTPPITGQWLSAAYLVPFNQVPDKYKSKYISPLQNKKDPVTKEWNEKVELNYIAHLLGADITSPLFSPMASEYYPPLPSTESKKPQLAKAFFQIAGMDPLRDHGLVYNRILQEEHGVQTRVELYQGYGHMFWTNWPKLEMSQKFSQDMVSGMKWLLS